MANASALEYFMLTLINTERAKIGVAPLQLEQRLNDAAEDHSHWMLEADVFSHIGEGGSSPRARMIKAGFDFSGTTQSGENVGLQSERGNAGLEDDVTGIHRSLMNSAGHRANLLSPNYDYIGLGIERGDYKGFEVVMITQTFASTEGSVVLDTGGGTPVFLVASAPAPPEPEPEGPVLLRGNSADNRLDGTAGADTIHGSGGEDTLTGQGGNDLLRGNYGDDRLDGQGGADMLRGGRGDDTVSGGGGNDTLWGEPGDDDMSGGNGHDRLIGSSGADILRGGGGNDSLNGGNHGDSMYGEEGNDTLSAGRGNDLLVDARGDNELRGGSGRDTVTAGEGADRIFGDGGADTLHGGAGSDTIRGGGAADTIDGGQGDDLLIGDWGRDHFIFVPGGGNDTLRDFEDGRDIINLTAYGFGSLTEIANRADVVTGDVILSLGGGDSLTVENTLLSEIIDELSF